MHIRQRVIQGRPIKVGEREIIPEARLTWMVKRQATFGTQGSSGYGWIMVNLEPTALIERWPGLTRRTLLRNQTDWLLIGLLFGAVALFLLIEWAVRQAMGSA